MSDVTATVLSSNFAKKRFKKFYLFCYSKLNFKAWPYILISNRTVASNKLVWKEHLKLKMCKLAARGGSSSLRLRKTCGWCTRELVTL